MSIDFNLTLALSGPALPAATDHASIGFRTYISDRPDITPTPSFSPTPIILAEPEKTTLSTDTVAGKLLPIINRIPSCVYKLNAKRC